jgi:glycosyltransferase involved in cell wall biosynthesis
MKVLWFTNVPAPAMLEEAGALASGVGGHWVSQLLNNMPKIEDIELGVVSAHPDVSDNPFVENGVTYFPIKQPARFPAFGMRKRDIDRCVEYVSKFQPDLLHFHGSERFYGEIKAAKLTNVPAVVSIQGLLGPCSKWQNFFGSLSPVDVMRSIRFIELPLKLGLAWQYISLNRAVQREARIIASVEGLLGRTDWDNAYATQLNPDALYCRVGEILRPSFADVQWKLDNCDRYSIIYTNAGNPRRGTENLLGAVALLRKELPQIRLRLAGRVSERSGYGRFLLRHIRALGIEDNVELLGFLNEPEMIKQLLSSHIFAITSYIENSPNSLAEAMTVGMPCVASYVGGIPSMVIDGKSGSLTPVGDIPLLAHTIRNLMINDNHAQYLGENARQIALARHDPATVISQLSNSYKKILEREATSQ